MRIGSHVEAGEESEGGELVLWGALRIQLREVLDYLGMSVFGESKFDEFVFLFLNYGGYLIKIGISIFLAGTTTTLSISQQRHHTTPHHATPHHLTLATKKTLTINLANRCASDDGAIDSVVEGRTVASAP